MSFKAKIDEFDRIRKEIEAEKDKLKRCILSSTSIGCFMSPTGGVSGGSSGKSKQQSYIEQKEKYENRLRELRLRRDELRFEIDCAIETLPNNRMKNAMRMKVFAKMSEKEISERLKISRQAVNRALRKGFERLG